MHHFVSAGLPSILVRPEETVLALAGSEGSLTCVANAEPPPAISWFRNKVELTNASFPSVTIYETTLNSTLDGNLLSVLEVCPFEDTFSGNFSCQASNLYGNATALFQILVLSGDRRL